MSAGNLIEAFHATATRLGDSPAMRHDGTVISWRQLRERVAAVAAGLLACGVRRGDRIALLLTNGPDLIPCDLGAVTIGAVPFSVYHTLPAERLLEILQHATPTVVIAETGFLERFKQIRGALPCVEHVVVVDPNASLPLGDIEARGRDFDDVGAARQVRPDDLVTLIYTSGTTGAPKAVPLSHLNVMSHIASVAEVIPFPATGARVVSWLPPAHIAERMSSYYQPMARGGEIVICPDPKAIVDWLHESPPHWFLAVPRIWEKLEVRGREWIAGQPERDAETMAAKLDASLEAVRRRRRSNRAVDDPVAKVEDKRTFAALRRHLGLDDLIAGFSGAAPVSDSVLEFMHAIGVQVGEMYGMSEAGGSVALAAPDQLKLGTVGPALPGIELRLAGDGEILLRGEPIAEGYWKNPEDTRRAFGADGWFASGDLGVLDEEGFLTVIGRKKEIIVNSSGKNMSPTMIENCLNARSPLIAHCVAIGDRRPYNVALVVLDAAAASAWANPLGLADESIAALAIEDRLVQHIRDAVDAANEHLARVEQIKKFRVLPTTWEPGGAELTPTSKLRRHVIEERYGDTITELYRD